MISETLPLNEMPVIYLKHLLIDLQIADRYWNEPSITTKEWIKAVKDALKDAEEREAKLPY